MFDTEEVIARTVATYDKIAYHYSECWLEHNAMEDILRSFLNLLPQECLVADIGCGIGRDMRFLVNHGAPVIGIDISAGMLREAMRIVSDGNFALMDMRNLGFPGQAFDGIWACASVLHIPKHLIGTVLHEFHRVLKDEGILYLSMQERTNQEIFIELEGRFFAYYSRDELTMLLEEHQFQVFDFHSNKTTKNTFNKPISVTWINYWARKA